MKQRRRDSTLVRLLSCFTSEVVACEASTGKTEVNQKARRKQSTTSHCLKRPKRSGKGTNAQKYSQQDSYTKACATGIGSKQCYLYGYQQRSIRPSQPPNTSNSSKGSHRLVLEALGVLPTPYNVHMVSTQNSHFYQRVSSFSKIKIENGTTQRVYGQNSPNQRPNMHRQGDRRALGAFPEQYGRLYQNLPIFGTF